MAAARTIPSASGKAASAPCIHCGLPSETRASNEKHAGEACDMMGGWGRSHRIFSRAFFCPQSAAPVFPPGAPGSCTLLISRSASGHWQATARRRLDEAAISKDIADWRGRSVRVVGSGTRQGEEAGHEGPCCHKGGQCRPAGVHARSSSGRQQPICDHLDPPVIETGNGDVEIPEEGGW